MRSNLQHQFWIALLLVLVSASVFCILPSTVVQAQSSPPRQASTPAAFELGVSPPTAYLKMQPGISSLHTITLINTSDKPVTLIPEAVSFEPDGTTGNPRLLTELQFEYIDRNRTSFDPFTIPADSEFRFPIYLTIPGDAIKGEYPMTILFRKQAPAQTGSPGVGGVVGSNLVVLVASEETILPKLSIADWQAARIVDSFGSITAAPIISNDTIAAQVASGSAAILNPFGAEIAEYTMSSDVVLGSSSRQLRWVDPDAQDITNQLSHKGGFLLGPHTIRVEINTLIDESVQNQYLEYKIIALPISLIVTILVASALIFGYRRYAQHSLK